MMTLELLQSLCNILCHFIMFPFTSLSQDHQRRPHYLLCSVSVQLILSGIYNVM